MFHTLLDHTPFSLQHDTPTSFSLLYPPNKTEPCAPQLGLWVVRLPKQGPLTISYPGTRATGLSKLIRSIVRLQSKCGVLRISRSRSLWRSRGLGTQGAVASRVALLADHDADGEPPLGHSSKHTRSLCALRR